MSAVVAEERIEKRARERVLRGEGPDAESGEEVEGESAGRSNAAYPLALCLSPRAATVGRQRLRLLCYHTSAEHTGIDGSVFFREGQNLV